MKDLVPYAIPVFFGLMLLEAMVARRRQLDAYEGRDTAASLSMGLGNVVVNGVVAVGTLAAWFWLYAHRRFDPGTGLSAWVMLFFAEDFTYYWFHRASHEVRLLWAAHVNHHSSQRYNLSTALRQSWTTPFTTILFYWPLPLLGFHPMMLVTVTSVSLIYQFWIHTEMIDRLGPLEWIFNTPSHHRVHHGSNVEYLDRNHGGILIVWDRLFGTFEPERARVSYGLTKNIERFNPWHIAFHEWLALARDVRSAPSARARLGYLLRPPGWRPDGQGQTARELRALPSTRVAA
jgi:sterol desaturase/sphingolipid hydroxylase (fatty acid hydroxylase superfamily)